MKKIGILLLTIFLLTQKVNANGSLQGIDFATPAQITAAGGTLATQLLNASYIWDSVNAEQLNATLAALIYANGSVPFAANQSLGSYALTKSIANAAGGTTVNKLAKLTGAPSTVVTTLTSDTNGVVGIVVSGAGTTGNAQVAFEGIASCAFDGATVAGDYVQISSTVAGDCHDAGASYPMSNQVLGRVLSTNAAAGSYAISIDAADIVAGPSGSTTFTQEVPTGTVNSSNTTFTLAHTPKSSSGVLVYLDGLIQSSSVASVSGTTITFSSAPLYGQTVYASYEY